MEQLIKNKPIKGDIVQVFQNADMRNGHDGLRIAAASAGIDTDTLTPGTYVVFINSKRTMVKLYAANNVIAFYRARAKEALDIRTIPMIVKSFKGSGRIEYDEALKQAVVEALRRRGK